MEKKALGRGLKALIPEIEPDKEADKILYLKTGEIKPNKYQPREDFDTKGIEELASSIKEKGLIQPVVVRRIDGGYELIAGERRLRAVKLLGIEKIPAVIKETESTESFILSLVENLQRQDLNPIEEARAYHRLAEEFEFTQHDIAESVKKDRASVANCLRLLKLPISIQNALSSGRISIGHAKAILAEEDEDKQIELFKRICAKDLSVRETEALARGRRPRRGQGLKDPHILSIEEKLQHILGTKVRVIHRHKRGTILIEYYSNEDLDRVYSLLMNIQKA